MLKSNKESGDYLKQIRNNIPEKIRVIDQDLNNESLPKTKDGKVRIIELGTGGGESLKKLKEQAVDLDSIEMVAVDILPKLVASVKKEVGVEGVAADAGNLPFSNESVSAINASAVLHEVSSYGTNSFSKSENKAQVLYGKEAVIQALGEFNRVLLPGGRIAYRDVLAPVGKLTEVKTVVYSRKAWRLFADWFLKDFSDSNTHFYEGTNTTFRDIDDRFSLTTSVGFQREFQRHYMMLIDYLRSIKSKEFGLTIVRSGWLNEAEGLKSITFSLSDHLASLFDLSEFEIHESSGEKIYRGDSDKFDRLYDDIMEYYFTRLKNGDDNSIETARFREIIELWKEREGLEHYIYGNVSDMLKFSCEASMNINSPWILFPESTSDVTYAPRFYYNRYLNQVADKPEKDGKQIIAFRKIRKEQALKFLRGLKDSGSNTTILDDETIEDLIKKLK